jgi:hypothetical protein
LPIWRSGGEGDHDRGGAGFVTGSTFNFWLGQFFGSLSPDLSPLLSLNII